MSSKLVPVMLFLAKSSSAASSILARVICVSLRKGLTFAMGLEASAETVCAVLIARVSSSGSAIEVFNVVLSR